MIKILDMLLVLYSWFYLGLFVTDYSFVLSSSGRISNIALPTLILALLVFFRWFIGKDSFRDSRFIKGVKKIDLDDKVLLSFAFSAIFSVLLALSIARHFALSSGTWDLGVFDQAIWNTSQGDILFSSLKNNINLLGDHFEPVLLLIAPLYKLWPNVTILFILQSLLLASAVIPLYLVAKYRLRERLLIFAFVASFVLSKPLRGVGLSDFHPECFILPLLFWAYYFLIKRRTVLLILSVFFLLLCKEDATFLVASLGIFAFCFQKKARVIGISLFILGLTLWFIETNIIIPRFNPLGEFPYMNRLPFGATYTDNLKAIIHSPRLLGDLFLTKAKLAYIIKTFGPLGFLSFLSPRHYILIAVPLLRNLIPVNPNFSGWYSISSHYTASLIPFIYIAAIYGAGRLIDKVGNKKTGLFISLLIFFSSLMFYGKTDAHKFYGFLRGMRDNHTLQKISYLRSIPVSASVATNFTFVPHLAHRKYIFEWNPQSKANYITEYIIVDKGSLSYLSSDDMLKVEPYFNNIAKFGYKQVFSGFDNTFLIFHNPDIDKSLVEKFGLAPVK